MTIPADIFGKRRGIKHKFRAIPTERDGIRFDSKREADRYSALRLLEKAGEISELEIQPVFPLVIGDRPVLIRSAGFPTGRRAKYIADFRYKDKSGARVTEDVKGMDTPLSALKRAIVEAQYGIRIAVTGSRK